MKIHEYQAKELFRAAGIPVPDGKVAHSVDEASAIYDEFGGTVAVKSQVHVGGRGKAGGIKLAHDADGVKDAAEAILGMDIKGCTVRKVLVERGSDIAKEAYLAVIIDRAGKSIGFIGSAEGGVEIEEVAKTNPDAILQFSTTELVFPEADAKAMAEGLFGPECADQVMDFMRKLFQMFIEKDCSLAEINPLVLTGSGEVIALDGKVNFDDNALFRQPEVEALRDMDEENVSEIEAKEKGLSLIQLDGNIGCMVNGAGLAMATMDMINLFGGSPANFLDVGGSSNPEKVVNAFKFILASGKIDSILINIFGGITRCDDIATGILQAFEQIDIDVPIVVRLAGTNAEEGKQLLEGTKLIPAVTLSEAVKKAIELSKGGAA